MVREEETKDNDGVRNEKTGQDITDVKKRDTVISLICKGLIQMHTDELSLMSLCLTCTKVFCEDVLIENDD